jgi:hypothetical protein
MGTKSKWLRWEPSPGIIEKPPSPHPSKPTKPSSVGSEGPSAVVSQIDRRGKHGETWWEELAIGDARGDYEYRDRLQAALRSICPQYPAGMLCWLGKADAALYDVLTRQQPDLIRDLWNTHAPIEEFNRAVDNWLGTHRRACSRFRQHKVEKDGS